MSTVQILLYALVAAAAIAGLVVIVLVAKPWRVLSSKTTNGQRRRYAMRKAYSNLMIATYKVLSKFPLTKVLIINTASMMKHMYVLEEDEAKVRATSILVLDAVAGLVTMIVSLEYFKDTMLSVIMMYMIVMYVHQKIIGDGQKFLEELEEVISDMVHMYNAGGKNIDRMFSRVLEDRHSYMHKYMEQMFQYLKQALMDTSNQAAITEYNRIAASRHLRLIFNYLYTTHRYGDEVSASGEQLFNRNMLAIQREIHKDFVKMKSIKDETIGEQWFIILAIVMIPASSWYMETFFTFEGFESIARFLNSSFGYTVKIACAVVALICYYAYSKLMASNVALEFHKEIAWEENIINKSRPIKKLIDRLAPKENTPRRKRLESDISMSEGYAGVRPLYFKKICLSVVITLIVAMLLSIDTYTSYRGITDDIYRGVNRELMDTIVSLEDSPEAYKAQSLSNDLIVIDILKENQAEYFELGTTEDRQGYIETIIQDQGIDYGMYYEIAAQRICEKFVLLDKINPTILALVLLITFGAAYMIPNLTMKLNLALNKGAIIYDEVNGCYTVVVLLINHSVSNVYMLLNWLTSFAIVFKPRFQACVDNLSEHEIEELEAGVNYKPLSRLIECISLAYKGAELKAAFAGIEQRHMFQEESSRVVNEQVISKRVAYSKTLSWIAMGTTFIAYIMVPMLLSILEMLLQLL